MVLPNLIHPVPITLELINRAGTSIDPDIGEPIQRAARAVPIVCPGQVKWVAKNSLRMAFGGMVEDADGYVVFRRVDLRALGVTDLQMNDRITAMGAGTGLYAGEWYITRTEPFGHWQDQGGAALLKAWFKDRNPAKTR